MNMKAFEQLSESCLRLKYAQHVDHKGVYMYMLSCSSELTEYYTGFGGGGRVSTKVDKYGLEKQRF